MLLSLLKIIAFAAQVGEIFAVKMWFADLNLPCPGSKNDKVS